MNHIHYVYRKINRPVEEPKYEFDGNSHYYPDSEYNKYTYNRTWDPVKKRWTYTKIRDTTKYTSAITRRFKILNMCLSVITIGTVVGIFSYNYIMTSISNQSRRSKKMVEGKAGMYMTEDFERVFGKQR